MASAPNSCACCGFTRATLSLCTGPRTTTTSCCLLYVSPSSACRIVASSARTAFLSSLAPLTTAAGTQTRVLLLHKPGSSALLCTPAAAIAPRVVVHETGYVTSLPYVHVPVQWLLTMTSRAFQLQLWITWPYRLFLFVVCSAVRRAPIPHRYLISSKLHVPSTIPSSLLCSEPSWPAEYPLRHPWCWVRLADIVLW